VIAANRACLVPLLAAFAAGCAAAPPVAIRRAEAAACPASVDVAGLLARHAGGFGSPAEVESALPRSFDGEFELQGRHGSMELVLDRGGRYGNVQAVDGMVGGDGIDDQGPWGLDLFGVAVRLRDGEAQENAYAAWMNRRGYLESFDALRDSAVCAVQEGAPRVTVRYRISALGDPELTFSLGDAALLAATHSDLSGRIHRTFLRWSERAEGRVRWPMAFRDRDPAGNETRVSFAREVSGVVCATRAPGASCLSPPPSKLRFSWPAASPVRVPMRFYQEELSLSASVGGREHWALLDSGAALTALDVTTPLGNAFRPALQVETGGSDQGFSGGLGALAEPVALGGLLAEHLPALGVPIPLLESFGERRPEIILGFSFFIEATIRVDYQGGELALAKSGEALHSPRAVGVPMKLLGSILAVEASVDGVSGLFQLDTGAGLAVSLDRRWAEPRGFPGARPTLRFRARGGAGEKETEQVAMRAGSLELGPIRVDRPLAKLHSPPFSSGAIAGVLGNEVFARCAAVVFDVARRTLWLEPPCDRAVPETLAGWRLERRDDPGHPGRPWVVKSLIPGGSAEQGGLQPGDRLLEVGSKPAVLDRSRFEAETEQPPGTQLPITFERQGALLKRTLRLVRPLDGEPMTSRRP
jgi:hypothetical protein